MRAVLLAVLLFALPAHAESYLEVHYLCGEPAHMVGFVDGEYRSAKWKHIILNSDLMAFFDKVIAALPIVDGKALFGGRIWRP